MSFFKSMATVSGFTLLSRITGYFRDVMIGSVFGDTGLSDIFFQAFRLPNLFRRLFAEGALNSAFIPLFSKINVRKGKRDAQKFAQTVFTILGFVLLVLTLVFELFMPQVMGVISPGFKADPNKFHLAVHMGRIVFPYIFFIAMGALCAGVLNGLNRFVAATASPLLLNIFCITALLWHTTNLVQTSYILSWSVLAAGIAQFIWVLYACHLLDYKMAVRSLEFSPEVKKLLRRMVPGLASAGVYQINLVISNSVASYIPMAVSYLAYADRINQFPLAMTGIGIGTVLLPLLSEKREKENFEEAQYLESRVLQFGCFLTFPATIALYVMALPIIITLFQHGRFTSHMSIEVAKVLCIYVLALPPNVAIKILSTSFFARGNTKTPMLMATISILVNIGLTFLFFRHFSYYGIAAAAVTASWVNMFMLGGSLLRTADYALDKRILSSILRLLIAGALMGGGLFLIRPHVMPYFGHQVVLDFFILSCYVGFGLIVYLLSVWLLKGLTVKEFQEIMNRADMK